MHRQDVTRAAHAAGLGEWADALTREARPSLRLVVGDGGIVALVSHVGGELALPAGHEWPTWRGTDWGDSGTIYYWIRREAVEARAFERAWFVLQCY